MPLGNPYTASALTRLALAIAKERDYELECLHTVVVPAGRSPSETPIDLGDRCAMLDYAFKLGQQARVNVHVQVRTAHDVSQAILETIDQRHVDLVLMEAKGTVTSGILGNATFNNPVLSNATRRLGEKVPCELALLRWSPELLTQLEQRPDPLHLGATSTEDPALLEILQQLRQWVVFLGGGPNAKCALRLLPGLTTLERSAGIHLCQITSAHQRIPPDPELLKKAQRYLQRHTLTPITAEQAQGNDVLSTLLSVGQEQDASVLIMGASQESFMQQAIRGNLPEQVMAKSNRTIILIRDALHNLQ